MSDKTFNHCALLAALVAVALTIVGCGSAARNAAGSGDGSATARASNTIARSSAIAAPVVSELAEAEHPQLGQFPQVKGRTIQQLTELGSFGAQLGAATGTFTPGTRRFAFAVNAPSGQFIYSPTAIYLARSLTAPVEGPFLAAADPTGVPPRFRSEENAGPAGLRGIYAAQIPLSGAGTYSVLALTRTPKGLIASPGEVAVAASSPIPNVGQRAPAIATDTLASVHGNERLLTTRIPPESMHSVSFKDVLGKRPIALLISTPQLCVSKVCGPVTDIMVSLQPEFAGRITFIHEEVYVNNQPTDGLRPGLKAFHLETEPWLFTVNRQGIIAARLEGAFGVDAARSALHAALQ